MLRDIDHHLPAAQRIRLRVLLARPATGLEPISHNTVRQLLLWYGAETRLALLMGEDGLIEFALPTLEI